MESVARKTTTIKDNYNSVIGYAILAVNIDTQNSTYLDYFKPLIVETIRKFSTSHLNSTVIATKMRESFGIKIPSNVVLKVLRDLSRTDYVNYDANTKTYKPSSLALEDTSFKDIQDKILGNHDTLVRNLKDYLNDEFNFMADLDAVEKMFEAYLESTNSISTDNLTVSRNYMIASYIKIIEERQSADFIYYESLVKGNMLASAVYNIGTNISETNKFEKTEVYLDAPLIIYALGYAGDLRADPVLELIGLLKDNNAYLRCYEHSVQEVKDILNGCITKLERGLTDNFGTVEYFLTQKYNKSDIVLLIDSVEINIKKKLGIMVTEKPDFKDNRLNRYNIDEKEFTNHLKNQMNYKHLSSLDRDVESIHSVIRKRKGTVSEKVEKSKAIFVTNNNRLTYLTRRYFNEIDVIYSDNQIPPAITDYSLTTLLWVKNPNLSSNLPRKRIISDCYAAMQPTEELMLKYIQKIDELKESGEINYEDFARLRLGQESRDLLMNKTLGQEEVLDNAKLHEILDLARKRELNEQLVKIDDYEKEKNELSRKNQERNMKLMNRAYNISKVLHGIGLLILGIVIWYVSKEINSMPDVVEYILGFFLLGCLPALGLFEFGLKKPFNKSRNFIAEKIYDKLFS